jgi:hypothetical protein
MFSGCSVPRSYNIAGECPRKLEVDAAGLNCNAAKKHHQ